MKIPKITKLPSGSWFCQLRIDGQSISITDDDPDIVTAKAYAYKAGVLKAKRESKDITLGEAIDRYIDSHEGVLAPSTVSEYKKTRKNHFQELMGVPLSKITQQRLQKSVSDLSKMRAPKTVRNAYMLVSAALKDSMPNETFHVMLPQRVKYEYAVPSSEDIAKILAASKGTPIELPVVLALWLGLRMSEIRGLRKCDLNGGVLHVHCAIVTVDGKPVEKTTKTYSSDRKIHVPAYVEKLITAIDVAPDEHLVPLSGKAIYHRFCRMCEKLDLNAKYRFHDLRHACASCGLALGVPDKYMQERMGHATDLMLKSVYQHTMNAKTDEFSGVIDQFFESLIANKNANE